MPYFASRATFDPTDPYRREFYLWNSVGPMDPYTLPTVALRPASGSDVACAVYEGSPVQQVGMSREYCVRVRVPAVLAAGAYAVRVNGSDAGLAVAAVAPRADGAAVRVGPSRSWRTTVEAFARAGRPVELQGLYELDRHLTLPAGSILRAARGAAEVRCAGGTQLLHTGGGSSTRGTRVEGISWVGEGQNPFSLGTGYPELEDVTFVGCQFRGLSLGHARGVYDCRFLDAGWNPNGATPRIAYRNHFAGSLAGTSTPLYVQLCPDGGFAAVENTFQSSGRGVGFNGGEVAETSGHLVWFNRAVDLNQCGNGSEFVLFEGGVPASDNLTGHNQLIGGNNVCVMFFAAGGARNTILYNRMVGGSVGVWLAPNLAGTAFTDLRIHSNVFQRVRNPVLLGSYDTSGAVKAIDPAEIDWGTSGALTDNTFITEPTGPRPPYSAPLTDPGNWRRANASPWAWEEFTP